MPGEVVNRSCIDSERSSRRSGIANGYAECLVYLCIFSEVELLLVDVSIVLGLVEGGGLTLVLMDTISDFVRFLGGEKNESNVRLDIIWRICLEML